ncbi:NADH-quinone oxidoreductase subunit L [Glycomyces algeriensis]|uniref:NADH-quinone oxidoreductase subunit L n=1 Tax=Glycomyces algeriensis TaxID=256037 RepID=A0A9W6G521_9ACTN|nr:NADH-quinone oxidoreductase subunit L [Glycomyces algeriensis]MDA1367781.1 NADH-quinone oxidoreductase subunit L [Glycomyces algeriensis]MDR7352854.1 NADH-quinone oxidoreductase subunit L [Glycomyces algeriensis]GLI40540.1 NADH-quinone oxidoreductase subunit L [Glycomyces algeriensis]
MDEISYAPAEGVLSLAWLLIALPAIGAAVLLLTGRRSDKWGHWLGVATIGGAFALALAMFSSLAGLENKSADLDLFTILSVGDLDIEANLLFDPLSAVFCLLITGVGFLIHVYAVGYMAPDAGRRKFFAYFNLFVAAMLILVLGGNYFMTFIGWEGVGLASYLLISFWQMKPAAATAGKKAFLTNRVADVGFLLAMFTMIGALGTVDFAGVFNGAASLSTGTSLAIGLLLLAAACGKSGQFPFQTWLPDAMEGPTPVSALIHAATMVTAGVYLIARSHVIFSLNADVQTAVVIVGALTLLFGAVVGCAKDDIKRVLAWSTVSQIGYMFLAVGLGGGAFALGIIHLLAHGFFKAGLFLGSGSVMHAMNDQTDIRRFGGLWRKMPLTYATFAAGWLAIIGLFPFSGFFTKDPIIHDAFAREGWQGWAVGGAALLGAALTAFYMTRLFVLTFHGPKRWTDDVHPHESPAIMTVPLVLLGLGSLGAGALMATSVPEWLTPVFGEPHEVHGHLSHMQVTVATTVVVVLGAGLGWFLFRNGTDEVPRAAAWPVRAARADLGGEAVNRGLFERPSRLAASASVAMDGRVVDGAVNGLAAGVGGTSRRLLVLQTGFVRSYALSILSGAVIVVAALMVVVVQ